MRQRPIPVVLLVPSPPVATYDLCPEMSVKEVTDCLVDAILGQRHDAIICNFANADMVGHTGDLEAAVQAIETIDHCLDRVVEALHQKRGELLITADHGNAEQMMDSQAHQAHTTHTNNPVPLVNVGEREAHLRQAGALCDVAPTLLSMMGLEQPREMQGQSLIDFPSAPEQWV